MSRTINEKLTLEDIVQNTADGVFVLDRQRRFVMFNPACERLSGYKSSEVLDCESTCAALTSCEDQHGRSLAGFLCPLESLINNESLTSARHVARVTTRQGTQRWVETVFTPIRDLDGEIAYYIGIARDAGERHELEEQYQCTIDSLRQEVETLREQISEQFGISSMVSRSPVMQAVLEKIRGACAQDEPVLITGELGTDKELIARTIHTHSSRQDGPFLVASAAILGPDRIEAEIFGSIRGGSGDGDGLPGLCRSADGGTLFIDGVDLLPPSAQSRLVMLMETGFLQPSGSTARVEVNVRILAGASCTLADLASRGLLQDRMFRKLGSTNIEMPPLRVCKQDIPLMVQSLIHSLNQTGVRQVEQIDPDAWNMLLHHDWPGNTHELRNVIESAYVSGSGNSVGSGDLVFHSQQSGPASSAVSTQKLDRQLEDFERKAILDALRRAGGQRSRAAKMMGISRSRLYRRMEALGIMSEGLPET